MQLLVFCTLRLSILIQLSYAAREKLERLDENPSRSVSKCLETLIGDTNWMGHNFLAIFDETVEPEDNFLKRYTNFTWKIYSGGDFNFTGFFNVILLTKDFRNLDETLRLISIQQIDNRAKLVIGVMENFSNLGEIREASKEIPELMWELDKTRVLYLIPCQKKIFAMTYFPFARNCQAGELEVLDIWTGMNFENRSDLFPEKMLDVRGCAHNQSVIFNPLLGFQLRKEFAKSGETVLGGVGGQLANIITKKLNLKMQIYSEKPGCWDTLIDLIIQRKSLLSIGGNIPTAGRSDILEQDIGYMQESYGFAYIPGDFEVSWKNLVWPLSNVLWGCVLCTCLLFFGFIFFANRCYRQTFESDKLNIFDIFAVFLGASRVLPRRLFARYLMGMWIIYSFLINNSYTSALVSFLTTPREMRIIKTLDDLLSAGMEFGGSAFFKEFYNVPSDPVMMRIYDKFKTWSPYESDQVFIKRKGARDYLSTFGYTYNGNSTGNARYKVRMLEDKVFSFYSPIFMRKGSPFVFGVRRYTSQLVQSGIVEYWMNYYDRDSGYTGKSSPPPTVFSTQHLQGIFYLAIVGLIISSLVFIFELIYCKYSSRRLDR